MQLSHLPTSPVASFLEQQGYLLLDGGLATELEKRGHSLNNKLWSASLLNEHPGEIQEVHQCYLDAGADCITAATYQASIPGFMAAGHSERKAKALILKSVDIACDARDYYFESRSKLRELQTRNEPQALRPLVAASIGPYGAWLADGSEFRGDYLVSSEEIRLFHESRWEILVDSRADLFAIETIPSFREAEVILDLLKLSPGIFAWVSFSCADGIYINDGTPLAECARLFANHEQIVAIGANCTAPQYIHSLIQQTRKGAPAKHVVVYPNSGERYDASNKTWSRPAEAMDFGSAAVEWFNHGANLLGGCCRTGPGDIAKMKNALAGISRQ